jgi:uridine kinase
VDSHVRRFLDLAADIRAVPGAVRFVGVDGLGGAGKTTFATRLAAAANGAPVVHTDDFASHDVPLDWAARFLDEVIDPLLAGRPATFYPYDWVARRPAPAPLTIEPAPIVVIEGVSATRAAWRDRLALRIWVECPRDLRLQRGLARDGEALREFWRSWMAAEDDYVATENPRAHADLVIDGAAAATDQVFATLDVSGRP